MEERFTEIALDILSDDVLLLIFRKMEPIDIVNLCQFIPTKCHKFRYWNILILEFFNQKNNTYERFKSLTEYYLEDIRIFDLNWPSGKNFANPSMFELQPSRLGAIPEEMIRTDVIIETTVPRNGVIRYILVEWNDDATVNYASAFNNYDYLLAELFDKMYDNAFEKMIDNLNDKWQYRGDILSLFAKLGYSTKYIEEGIDFDFDSENNYDELYEKLNNKDRRALIYKYSKEYGTILPKNLAQLELLLPKKQGEIKLFWWYSVAEVKFAIK